MWIDQSIPTDMYIGIAINAHSVFGYSMMGNTPLPWHALGLFDWLQYTVFLW